MRILVFLILAFSVGYFDWDIGGLIRGLFFYLTPVALVLTGIFAFLAKKFFVGSNLALKPFFNLKFLILVLAPTLTAAFIGNALGKYFGLLQVDFEHGGGLSDKGMHLVWLVVPCITQEFLWRGFFLGNLIQTKMRYPLMVSAFLFALWATPYYRIAYGASTNALPWVVVFLLYFFTNMGCAAFWGWLRIKSQSVWVPALSASALAILLRPGLIPFYKVTGFFPKSYIWFDFLGIDHHGPLVPRIVFVVAGVVAYLFTLQKKARPLLSPSLEESICKKNK